MAFALTDAFVWCDGYDFTSDTNEVTADMSAAVLDKTTFGSGGWTEVTAGPKSVAFSMSGFWQAGATAVDPTAFASVGVANKVTTFGLDDTEGSACFLWRGGFFNYQMFGEYGQLAPFSLSGVGTDGAGVVRGAVAKAKGSVSATGALGTALELGAVAADEYLYASFHVFPTAGTTITVVLESDSASDFASATTRATIGALTSTGGTWATRVAGSITDTFYRFRVTDITGTFTVAGAIGMG